MLWEKRARVMCKEYKKFLQMLVENGLKDLPDIVKVQLFDKVYT